MKQFAECIVKGKNIGSPAKFLKLTQKRQFVVMRKFEFFGELMAKARNGLLHCI